MSEEHWRWNVDHAWENFSIMIEECYRAEHSSNEFERNGRMRLVLDSAGMCLESFANKLTRESMAKSGKSEGEIVAKLKKAQLPEKLTSWVDELCKGQAPTNKHTSFISALVGNQRQLRNRLVHPKEYDHSIYVELERTRPSDVATAVAMTIVTICERTQRMYPYWVLGWNFVGFNGDPAHPCLLDAAQFIHALARLHFLRVSEATGANVQWQGVWLRGLAGFSELKAKLDNLHYDIEPWFEYLPGFGAPPRLCRRWWDRTFIMSTLPQTMKA